jgi:hypothetical protein
LLSFDTWLIFSKLLHQEEGSTLGLLRYRQAIQQPLSPLHVYATPLTSSSFDFITSLSITTAFPLPDLVRLSKVTNLGVLEIINTAGMKSRRTAFELLPAVSDRLIRAWNYSAQNDSAFQVLRILKLWNHEELTSKSLAYLNAFPALALYDVRGCAFDLDAKVDAKRIGWRATVDSNVLGLLEAACVERAMLMQQSLGVETRPVRKATARQLWDGSKTRRIPRSEVPSFLTRPEALLPGQPLVEYESYSKMQSRLDIIECHYPQKSIKDVRWKIMDRHLFSKSRALETWEFTNYTSFAKIGELRNDTDLSRAGVNVGDSVALVGNELVNSIPIVSLRLGDTPSVLQTSSVNSAHKPFYSSLYSESTVSSLKYDSDKLGSADTRTLAFIRIKVPPAETRPNTGSSQHTSNSRIRNESLSPITFAQATPGKRRGVGVMKSKKRKIGDVLNSFR